MSHSTIPRETLQHRVFSGLAVDNIDLHFADDASALKDEALDKLREQLATSDWFIVVLSRTTAASLRVRTEVDFAFEQLPDAKILVVQLEDCEPSSCHQKLALVDSFNFYDDAEGSKIKLSNRLQGRVEPTADFSQRVMEIFEEIYDLDLVDRIQMLDEKAGDDFALRLAVENLLNGKAGADAFSFLEASNTDLQKDESLVGKSVGAFKVIRKIAMGGMGVVYEARHAHLDRSVALKIPILTHQNIKVLSMRLKREGKALAKLRHPNVVEVYDAGVTEDEIPFIAMGYIDGKSLYDVIKAEMGTPEQIKLWITQVAQALDYLHKEKIIHRDVKPSNIMIDKHDNAILMDFGIAHIEDLARVTLFSPGTPGYMCPEQRAGNTPDMRCDIYSLGVVLYELLTRDSPVAPDLKRLPRKTREQRLMAAVVAKCIERDPKDRYQTGGELASALNPVPQVPVALIMAGVIALFVLAIVLFLAGRNFASPELPPSSSRGLTESVPPAAVANVVHPPVIEALINQRGNLSQLMNQLITSRDKGDLAFGKEEKFITPERCYIFVFENENDPAQAVLAPGSIERAELISGTQIDNVPEYLKGKAAIWVNVTN